ncbi:MAG: phosphatidate cytidylyltransferase [Gemmatimonadetes bacterium]|nr:phosphatidate cytidylyltransferase [Gemmatimonadota bacterium]
MGELGKRVVVAVLGAPVAILALWWGDAPLATLLAIFAALGAREYCRLASASGVRAFVRVAVATAALVPLAVHGEAVGAVRAPPAVWPLVPLAVLALAIWRRPPGERPLEASAATVMAVLYTAVPLSALYGLRTHPYAVGRTAGFVVALLPLVLTWASDIGGYVAGRTIGGRKLLPSVSPGKTVAGAVGGVLLTVAATVALERWLLVPYAQLGFTPTGRVAFGVAVSVVAQVGDLAESLLKREAGVKDSGAVFPGHGGALDRLDSLFFVAPTAVVLYDLLLIPAIRG